jgi:hypothetical protein
VNLNLASYRVQFRRSVVSPCACPCPMLMLCAHGGL